jgi:multidrug efflux pump subunit AcrA (membrane-fusion protein)
MKNGLVVGLSYLVVIAWGCLPMLSNRMSMAIASVSNSVAVAQTDSAKPPLRERQSSQQKPPKQNQKDQTPTQSSKRLKIEIDVTSPGDLLVKEGQTVTANQLIADRQSERSTLAAQLQETNLSIERLKFTPKVSPVPPAGVKTLTSLPPKTSYGEEQAQIAAATAKIGDLERKYVLAQAAAKTTLPETEKVRGSKLEVKQAEEKIARHQQKIDALKTLEDIDQAVKDHEQVKLRELNRALIEATSKLEQDIATEGIARSTRTSHLADAQFQITEAQRELQLARARLITATEKRRQIEFDYQNKQTERGEQVERLELERVKLMETSKLQVHDREYQVAQLVLKQGQIQKQLETIGVVRTPHQGTIRRVKLVAQHGNLLRYEVSLIYVPNAPKPSSPVSQWRIEN